MKYNAIKQCKDNIIEYNAILKKKEIRNVKICLATHSHIAVYYSIFWDLYP